jgi:serine/threonine protein kinase
VSKLDFNAPDLLEFIGISPSVVPSSSSNSRNGGRSSGNSRNSSDEGRTLPTRIVLGDTIVLSNNGGGNNDSFLVAPYNLMAEYNDESKCVPQDLKMQLQGERSTLDYTSKLHMRYPRYADLLDYSAADWHRAKTINHGGFGVIMTVPWKSSSLFKDDDQEGYTTVVVKVSRESKKDGDGKMKRISHLRRLKHALCEAAYALAIGNHPLVDNSNDGDERNYRMNHGMKTALESFAKCYGWFIYGDGELAIVMERLDVDVNRALGYRQKDKKRIKQEIKRMAKDRRINFDDDDDDGSIIGRSDNVAKTQDELDEEEEALVLKWAKKRCTIGRGQALKIVYAMVHALVEMHDGELFGGGFIHRDIKPHNIMLNSDNEPRIIDFSFCLPLGSKSSISSTYIYSPPPFNREKKEQQDQQENSGRNDSHYYDTGACDWYALAVMVVNDIDPVIPLSKRVYDAAAMLMSNIADYGEEFDSVLVDRFVDIVDEKYFKYNGRRRSSSRGRSRSNSSTSRSKSEDDDDDDGHSSASSHYSRDSEYDSQEEGDYEAYATDGAGHYDVDSYDEDPKSYQSPLPPPPRHAEYRGATDNDIQDWWRDQRGPSIVSAIARRVSVAAMASPSSSSAPSPTQHDPTNGRQSWRSTPPANYD